MSWLIACDILLLFFSQCTAMRLIVYYRVSLRYYFQLLLFTSTSDNVLANQYFVRASCLSKCNKRQAILKYYLYCDTLSSLCWIRFIMVITRQLPIYLKIYYGPLDILVMHNHVNHMLQYYIHVHVLLLRSFERACGCQNVIMYIVWPKTFSCM